MKNSSFLDGDLRDKVPHLSNEIISLNQIRSIDYDYQLNILADMPNETEKLLAKNYLAQLAYGNANLAALSQIADEQGNTSNEIANLASTTVQVKKAIEQSASENAIALDNGFNQVVEATWSAAYHVSGAIENLAMQMSEFTDEIVNAICISQQRISEHLEVINNELNTVNCNLIRIEEGIINPAEVQVQELIRRTNHLIREATLSKGEWQADNIKDALFVLKEAAKSPHGITNGFVWFQKGYCLWQSCKDENDTNILEEAKQAFDRSARLFTAINFQYFVKALRHKAHMCYLLKDYVGAEASLLNIDTHKMDIDTSYDLARYKAVIGKNDEALKILWNCINNRSSLSITIFADIDFVRMRSSIANLIEKLSVALKEDIFQRSSNLSESLKGYNPTKNSDIVFRGTLKRHKSLFEINEKIGVTRDFVTVRSLYENYVNSEPKLNDENCSAFIFACVLALWGHNKNAATVLTCLINEVPALILKIYKTHLLKNIIELISRTIEYHTVPLRETTVKNIERMEGVINEIIRNYASIAAKRAATKQCQELIAKKHVINSVGYCEAYSLNELSITFFKNAFYRQTHDWLGEGNEISSDSFPIDNLDGKTKPYTDNDINAATFENILLMYRTLPEICSPDVARVASLFTALRAYCLKDNSPYCKFALNQISSNGIGVHLEFFYENHDGSLQFKDNVFIPNTEVSKMFGKKIIKFNYGDTIPRHLFVPSIMEWMRHTELRSIIDRIKNGPTFR